MTPAEVAMAAGVKTMGTVKSLESGETWLWGPNWASLVVVRDSQLLAAPRGRVPSVDERVTLYQLDDAYFVELEQRGERLLVRRGLLNGRFHETLSDAALQDLVEHFERSGFARGRPWSPDSTQSTVRVYWGPEVDQVPQTRRVRVDGRTVTVDDLSGGREETYTEGDHHAASARAEAVVRQLESEGFRTRNVEVVRALEANPPADHERARREPLEKHWVDWSPDATAPVFDATDVDVAMAEALPSLVELAPRTSVLRALPSAQPADQLVRALGMYPPDLAVLAQLLGTALPAHEPVVLPGSWSPKEPAVVVGDLTIEGDLRLFHPLIVTGRLVVSGHIAHDRCPLVVLGDLSARSIQTEGPLIIGGDTAVASVLYGVYNDDCAELHGSLTAGMVVSDEHAIVVRGDQHLRHRPDEPGSWGPDVFDARRHRAAILERMGEANYVPHEEQWLWDFVPADL